MDDELEISDSNELQTVQGYLYVAVGIKYIKEAEISATSLRRFTQLPICLVTSDDQYDHPVFSQIIRVAAAETYANKIVGLQASPFIETIFLDSDTFVCSSIDNVFEVLNIFDMAMTVDNFIHSYSFFQKHRPDFKLRYEGVIPEYNTGVIAMKNNAGTKKLLSDWMNLQSGL